MGSLLSKMSRCCPAVPRQRRTALCLVSARMVGMDMSRGTRRRGVPNGETAGGSGRGRMSRAWRLFAFAGGTPLGLVRLQVRVHRTPHTRMFYREASSPGSLVTRSVKIDTRSVKTDANARPCRCRRPPPQASGRQPRCPCGAAARAPSNRPASSAATTRCGPAGRHGVSWTRPPRKRRPQAMQRAAARPAPRSTACDRYGGGKEAPAGGGSGGAGAAFPRPCAQARRHLQHRGRRLGVSATQG